MLDVMIKAIIFDFGGVVLRVKDEDVRKRLCELLGIDEREFKELIEKRLAKLQTGKMSVHEFSAMVEGRCKVGKVEATWEQAYRETAVLNQKVWELAKKLKKKYRVGLISNVLDMHARLNRRDALYKPFDPVFLSCEVGMKKPEKGIFELALKKLGLKAGDCVFIDDRKENLVEPRKMGFHVIHFGNVKKLKNELKERGVK